MSHLIADCYDRVTMVKAADLPDPFPVHACWRPQALQIAQAVGPVVEPHFHRVMGLPVVEFRPRRHASFQEVPRRDEAVGRFLHTDGTSSHDDEHPSLGNMTHGGDIAHHCWAVSDIVGVDLCNVLRVRAISPSRSVPGQRRTHPADTD
jgi:hypothetical protein